jgi:hypothetical protein
MIAVVLICLYILLSRCLGVVIVISVSPRCCAVWAHLDTTLRRLDPRYILKQDDTTPQSISSRLAVWLFHACLRANGRSEKEVQLVRLTDGFLDDVRSPAMMEYRGGSGR